MSGIFQGYATGVDLVPQTWNSAPQQDHGAGDVRSGHGCADPKSIASIGAIARRACSCAGSSDIRLDAATAIDCYWPTVAKRSDDIAPGDQCPYSVRCRIDRWRS
jgi:hypothetical protein